MRQILIMSVFLFCNSYVQSACAQNADAIVGKWLRIPKEDLIIEVYKSGEEYQGKINWSKDNDEKKPAGFVIMEDLTYNPKSNIWENGKIRDPNSGNSYSASVKLTADSTLEVHGYLGMKLLGTTKAFKKVE